MDDIILKLIELGAVPLIILAVGWLIGKYITPWVHAKPGRLERAKEISMIADRLTDELVLAMPNARWDDILDKLVGRIIEELKLPPAVAKREAIHTMIAKQIYPSSKSVALQLFSAGR